MIGFCTRCKEFRGDGHGWGIVLRDGFPVCERCGAYVDVIM
jgi:hypothetical protein